jgi:hypothetical protein
MKSSSRIEPGGIGASFRLGMGRSVVIDDLDVVRVAIDPAETQAELLVDADAVLANTVAMQGLQPVAGRDAQVFEPHGRVQEVELAPRDVGNGAKPADDLVVEQAPRVLVGEGADRRRQAVPRKVLRQASWVRGTGRFLPGVRRDRAYSQPPCHLGRFTGPRSLETAICL